MRLCNRSLLASLFVVFFLLHLLAFRVPFGAGYRNCLRAGEHLGEGELSEGGLTFTGSSGRRGYETGYPVVHGRVLDICNKTLSNAWVEFDLRREGLV